jgi:hypothetical protein
MSRGILTLVILTLFISCKKDRLEGEKSVLIGRWKWSHSSKRISWRPLYYQTLSPQTENTTYAIEFLEKGKIKLIEKEHLKEEGRIVFTGWRDDPLGGFSFGININGSRKKNLYGSIEDSSLIINSYFPYEEIKGGVPYITNYFVRE